MNLAPTESSSWLACKHGLAWLVVGNVIGMWLSILLLAPSLGDLAIMPSYGRWAPVHLNVQLYGWTSFPLIAWLFHIYQVPPLGARLACSAWSMSLACGAISWLCGNSGGKIFLDWKDGALVAFLLAQVILWLVLMISWWRGDRRIWHGCGLLMMALVPVAMKVATSPDTYPPIDQTTGGPTGASLLGSTLSVVALLLLVPHSLGWKPQHTVLKTWLVWALQFLAFAALEWYGGSHFTMQQIIGLALLLPWLVWIPRYWNQFAWPSESLWWRRACVFWWGLLVVSGWVEFLPGILDRMKFTNGLVGHAHWAMAGFTSSFVCMLMVILGGSMAGRIFNSGALLWNLCALLMGGVLVICGWIEGASYEWMNDTPFWRWSLMFARAACGMGLLLVAARWSWLWNQSNKS